MSDGKIWLVGAGPGDPGLITVAGLARLAEADVVVYDRLASPRLLEHARADAELIYVGKQAGAHELSQEEINRLLVARASQGKRVVRLKGGDPFVFGRGGEEGAALRAAGIPFEVVPGVTAAVAAPAYAGIPVSDRRFASSFAVVTGHEDVAKDESAIRWDKLATAVDTIVFLMGRKTLPLIVEQLTAHGRPADTPVAVVQWAATPRQRTVVGTLADIVQRAEEAGLGAPAVTVVGDVVRLRSALAWYEQRPLFGKRVLVTRTRRQASALADLLAQEGAEAIELPVIQIVETVDAERLAEAVARLALSSPKGGYDWLVFTSANGVEVFFSHLRRLGRDARVLAGARVAAIGPATADALAERGIVADIVPSEFIAEGIVAALKEQGVSGQRVLLARAEDARPELVEGLRALGAHVDELPLYRSELPEPDAEVLAQLRSGQIDIVTFTSSSTVRHLVQMLGGDVECLRKAVVACIGPVTAKTAEELGLRVDVMASEHTVAGLVRAIRERLGR